MSRMICMYLRYCSRTRRHPRHRLHPGTAFTAGSALEPFFPSRSGAFAGYSPLTGSTPRRSATSSAEKACGTGQEGIRQPQQIHPPRDHRAGRLRHHIPRCQHSQQSLRDNTAMKRPTRPAAVSRPFVRIVASRDLGLRVLWPGACLSMPSATPSPALTGLTAFPMFIIVAAFQARSVTATAFTVETFDNRNLNWTALVELVLAVLIAHWEVLRRLFGTVELTLTQWALALVPAVLLFFIWELGKLISRRTATSNRDQSFFSAIFPPAIPCPRPPYVPPAPE